MGQGESGYIFNPTPLKEVLPDILIGPNPKLLRIKVGVRGRVEARPLARREPRCRQFGDDPIDVIGGLPGSGDPKPDKLPIISGGW